MSQFLRRGVPLIITSGLIIFLLAEYFVPYQPLATVGSQIMSWGVVIAAFLMPIGMITLIMRNIIIIQRRQEHWPYYQKPFSRLVWPSLFLALHLCSRPLSDPTCSRTLPLIDNEPSS